MLSSVGFIVLRRWRQRGGTLICSDGLVDCLDMKGVEWKSDPLYVLKAEFDNIAANVYLHGFKPSTRIRLENLSQRLEEQAVWREANKTGYVRFESRTRRPRATKLTLRFDDPTDLSEHESNMVHDILDKAARQLETMLKREKPVT